jgi:uncharacterized protein YjbI with pentapeptide repeats
VRKPGANEKGRQLEERVSHYYKGLGYAVTLNEDLAGHQIDIVARLPLAGASTLTLAIEAKYRSQPLGVNDITQFLGGAAHLLALGEINGAVIVTNAKITKAARIAVSHHRSIVILSTDDLDDALLKSTQALVRAVADYENRDIFRKYYPMDVTQDGEMHSDGAALLTRFAQSAGSFTLLIGDFGAGKSTLIERVFYNLCRKRLDGESEILPILLRLSGLRRYSDVWQFVEASLRDSQYLVAPRSILRRELDAGRLCILMDGFDEILSGATSRERGAFLALLAPLLKTRSPVILSSRPTLFDSFDSLLSTTRGIIGVDARPSRIPNFGINPAKIRNAYGSRKQFSEIDFQSVVRIKELSPEKIYMAIESISDLIAQELDMTPKQFENKLNDIYDLRDLMQRPLLLEMICNTIATGGIDISGNKPVSASTLYEFYTQEVMQRDKFVLQGTESLSPEAKIATCREIAKAMLEFGRLWISNAELSECIERAMRNTVHAAHYLIPALNREGVTTEVRSRAFLSFAADGTLRFTHKSFFEFFLAQELFVISFASPSKFMSLPRAFTSREILYFLGSYARDFPEFTLFLREQLLCHARGSECDFLQSIAFASGNLISYRRFDGGRVCAAELSKCTVEAFDAAETVFEDTSISNCTIRNSHLRSVRLARATFSHTNFEYSQIAAEGERVSLIDCGFKETSLALVGSELSLDQCRFNFGVLVFGGEVTVSQSTFKGCKLVKFDRRGVKLISNCRFAASNVSLDFVTAQSLQIRDTEFSDCNLSTIFLSAPVGHAPSMATLRVAIANCSGFLFLRNFAVFAEMGLLRDYKTSNPDLIIVDGDIAIRATTLVPNGPVSFPRTGDQGVEFFRAAEMKREEKRGERGEHLVSSVGREMHEFYLGLVAEFEVLPAAYATLPVELKRFMIHCAVT